MNSRDTSHLLLDEPVLQFLPSLACALGGTNEALILQQLHFLCKITEKARNQPHFFEGRWWVYNSYEEWRDEQFPWISISTIQRIFLRLEKDGLVLTRTKSVGNTLVGKWYTPDYERIAALDIKPREKKGKHGKTTPPQDDVTPHLKTMPPPPQNGTSYYTETTTETTSEISFGGEQHAAPLPKPKGKAAARIKRAVEQTTFLTEQELMAEEQLRAAAQVAEEEARRAAEASTALKEAIAEEWGISSGLIGTIRAVMQGKAQKGKTGYTANFDVPATADEVRSFAEWYRSKYPSVDMPMSPEKIQTHFYRFRTQHQAQTARPGYEKIPGVGWVEVY